MLAISVSKLYLTHNLLVMKRMLRDRRWEGEVITPPAQPGHLLTSHLGPIPNPKSAGLKLNLIMYVYTPVYVCAHKTLSLSLSVRVSLCFVNHL